MYTVPQNRQEIGKHQMKKNQLTLTMHFCLENTYVCSATARQAMRQIPYVIQR